MDNKIICVVGPTASGKTDLSIEIAKAFDGEIICADSMQIYKLFDIGTAKPTTSEMQGIKHHLVDFVDACDDFSVAEFVKLATNCISDIKSRGKTPVIVGGTGLYIDSLVRGIDFAKNAISSSEIREKYFDLIDLKGCEYVHSLLEKCDYESFLKLHPNDTKRVVRALEVFDVCGKTISQHNADTKLIPDRFDATFIGIKYVNRQELYDRINLRVDIMIQNGLVDELKHIISMGKFVGTASQAIGYKELLPFLNGEDSLENCTEKLKQESRRYAKRQLTWFNKNEKINWVLNNRDKSDILDSALQIIKDEFYG